MKEKIKNMQKQPALVGIVPRRDLWNVIQEQRWYHIPVKSAPKNTMMVEYLAFYFPKIFDKDQSMLKTLISY